MAVETLRCAIAAAYPGEGWKQKCMTMPDAQVYAIYNSFLKHGTFNKLRKPKRPSDPECRQMTIFDYGVKRPALY